MRGQFGFGGDAAKLRGEFPAGVFDAARLAAEISRTPIHLAQAIENGTANAEAGVGLELDISGGIKFVDGVDETEDSGVDKVVEGDVSG